MADWKPKLLPSIDVRTLTLSPIEGFVVSRVDGHTTVHQLALLTGQSPAAVNSLLERLVLQGAVGSAAAPVGSAPPPPTIAPVTFGVTVTPPTVEAGPDAAATDAATQPEPEVVTDPGAPGEPEVATDLLTEPEPEALTAEGATHLARYRQQFHHLTADERAELASTAQGGDLSALCFDPLPAVVRQVLANPQAGLDQARLIAAHHRNPAGLEWLLAKAELMRDGQVQRVLWRNPQLNEGQLRRLTQSKRLLELWKLSVSREAVGRTRTGTAKLLRARFPTASADERVELIFSTEGRALTGLSGLPIDGKTTSMLCARSYASMMLVQNLARWSVAPPPLIAHLLKQPLVARQPQLRALLLAHPNAPKGRA